jgi:hypothetical protein
MNLVLSFYVVVVVKIDFGRLSGLGGWGVNPSSANFRLTILLSSQNGSKCGGVDIWQVYPPVDACTNWLGFLYFYAMMEK